jgi:type IV secretory pathway VirB10-like protein
MARWSFVVWLVFCAASMFGQSQSASRNQGQATDAQPFSSDLVQWSYMQEAQQPEPGPAKQTPTPEPSPETQPAPKPAPSPSSHPAEPSPDSSPDRASSGQAQSGEAPAAQTFTGTVSKESSSFVLKVSETASYKLDNSSDVQQYEGKRVKVTGTLDSSINLIHVDTIEPIS